MKKLIILAIFLITGCAGTPRGIDLSSNCIYNVNRLECERTQVWQMRNAYGEPVKENYTMFWFESYDECMDFVKDPRNGEELDIFFEEGEFNCGVTGKFSNDGGPSVSNYYLYTDETVDGDFYYIIENEYLVKGSKREEWFTPIFTSKQALRNFQRMNHKNLTSVYGTSINNAKRIRVKKI